MPKMVSATQARSGLVVQPTPDGGVSGDTAGPVIQKQWGDMVNAGMSPFDATARLHGNLSIQMPPSLNYRQGGAPTATGTEAAPKDVPNIAERVIGAIWDPS